MFRRQIIYSPIMDCYNGEILTVEMRDNMKKEEVKTIVFRYIFIYYNRYPKGNVMFCKTNTNFNRSRVL